MTTETLALFEALCGITNDLHTALTAHPLWRARGQLEALVERLDALIDAVLDGARAAREESGA